MQVGILTKEPNTYDVKALISGFDKHKVAVLCIDYTMVDSVHTIIDNYKQLNAVFPRHIPEFANKVAILTEAFTKLGIYSPNSPSGIRLASNKSATAKVLEQKGIAVPKSIFFTGTVDIGLLESKLYYPVVAKSNTGAQGKNVHLIRDRKSLHKLLPTLESYNGVLVQEYIAESHGEDIRAVVVGDQVVAAMKRKSTTGGIVSNFHQGGLVKQARLSDIERQTAILAAETLKLGVVGVDILRSQRGPLVIELNSSLGFQGIERATNVSVAELAATYTIQSAIKKNG